MNADNIRKVADAIEQHSIAELGFNMRSFHRVGGLDTSGHECETTACIGGWTLALLDPQTWKHAPWDSGRAAALLGLDAAQEDELFFPYLADGYRKVRPARAVAVLRHLADRGTVDWTIGAPVDA